MMGMQMMFRTFGLATLALALAASAQAAPPAKKPPAKAISAKTPPAADILKASPKSDWRPLNQVDLLYMDLPKGRVIIELAPDFAPNHVANIKILARNGFFNAASIVRLQDNFVVQWGIPDGDKTPPLGQAKTGLAPEFTRPSKGLAFIPLPDRDAYAKQVGFVGGFPVGRDPATGRSWLTHCYGTVGIGRDVPPTSGNGGELYAVIGQARHIDRNLTVVGRVVQGMPILASLPRGEAAMGFYANAAQRLPLKVRMGSDLPASEQVQLETLRTDSKTFATIAEARRNRRDDFYTLPAGGVDVCNITVAVRPIG
jgi:peptidylprolyl isomerase